MHLNHMHMMFICVFYFLVCNWFSLCLLHQMLQVCSVKTDGVCSAEIQIHFDDSDNVNHCCFLFFVFLILCVCVCVCFHWMLIIVFLFLFFSVHPQWTYKWCDQCLLHAPVQGPHPSLCLLQWWHYQFIRWDLTSGLKMYFELKT